MVSEHRSEPHTLEEFSFQNLYNYYVRSVWDSDGGYAFNETSIPGKFIHAFRQLPLFNPLRGDDAFRACYALYHHIMPTRTFGDPSFSPQRSPELLREIDAMAIEPSQNPVEASDRVMEELRHLGYL